MQESFEARQVQYKYALFRASILCLYKYARTWYQVRAQKLIAKKQKVLQGTTSSTL